MGRSSHNNGTKTEQASLPRPQITALLSSPEEAAPPVDSRYRVKAFVQELQDQICRTLEALDGEATFREDGWERPGGGTGRSRVIREGRIFEQGGVNFSEVWGDTLPPSILAQRPEAAHRWCCILAILMCRQCTLTIGILRRVRSGGSVVGQTSPRTMAF